MQGRPFFAVMLNYKVPLFFTSTEYFTLHAGR